MNQNIQRLTCPACGYKTIYQEYDICAICRWEYDYWQLEHPEDSLGANGVSLINAQRNFLLYGACTPEEAHSAKTPDLTDERDLNWKAGGNDNANKS